MLGFIASIVAGSSAVGAVDDAGLRRMIEATQQICADPTSFGYSVTGNAQAGVKAQIPEVLEKLFEVGLSGSVKAQSEVHSGPAQKDVGAVQLARLQCAQNVFADLNRHYAITNRSTGKPVAVGSNPIQTFKMIIASPATSGLPTVVNSGSGDQAVSIGQQGGINANHIDSVTLAKDRHIYLAMLQDIYSQGQTVLSGVTSHYPSDQVTSLDLQLANSWISASANRIAGMMTLAAAQSFMSVRRSAMSSIFTPPLNPAPSAQTMINYNNIVDLMPQYLHNVQYLMEHDTMDPQNSGSAR